MIPKVIYSLNGGGKSEKKKTSVVLLNFFVPFVSFDSGPTLSQLKMSERASCFLLRFNGMNESFIFLFSKNYYYYEKQLEW